MKIILPILCLIPVCMQGCGRNAEFIFPDAVVQNLADPFVLLASDGVYYMYGTSTNSGGGFPVYYSADLVNWTSGGPWAYTNRRTNWAYRDFWAPEVVERNGNFYMFYSAREFGTDRSHIGLAVSGSPLGPFIDERGMPLLDLDYENIDGHVFIDEDGRIYMYYSRDARENIVNGIHRSDIYAVELDQNFLPLGEPVFLFAPSQPWETVNVQQGWRWNEGASVIKVDGVYYMTYSGNPYFSFEYAIGIATSKSPLGPWEKNKNNPAVRGSKKQSVSGTGHNSIFTAPGGKIYIAYHVHINPEEGGGRRKILISRAEFKDNVMRLINE